MAEDPLVQAMELFSGEPKSFEKLLTKLFGVSSKVLQQIIGETLLSKVGAPGPGQRPRVPGLDYDRESQVLVIVKHYSSRTVAKQARQACHSGQLLLSASERPEGLFSYS